MPVTVRLFIVLLQDANAACSIRKVKCDETKPQCKKCISTGRKCDGYSTTASKPKGGNGCTHRALLPSVIYSCRPVPTTPIAIAPLQIALEENDRLAYEFFLQKSAMVIWHISPPKQWIQIALQLSLREETLFYAASAVGSIHRAQKHFYHHTLTEPALPEMDAGVQQYCKATASLQRYIDGAISEGFQLEPVLLCCILFTVFEIFQGRSYQALSHLRLGRSLFNDDGHSLVGRGSRSCRFTVQSSTLRTELLEVFEKMQAELDAAPRTFCPPADHRIHFTMPGVALPTYFASMEMAKESLCNLMAASARFRLELVERAMNRITPPDKKLREAVKYCIANCLSRTIEIKHDRPLCQRESELKRAHSSWRKLLDDMKRESARTASASLDLMEIQHFFSEYTLVTCKESKEESADQFKNEHARVLDLIERYLKQVVSFRVFSPAQMLQGSPIQPEPQRSFSLENGILPTLLYVY